MVNTEIRFIICFAVKAEELYTVNKNKTGADYASDLQLLIANFRLKLKKVGKTIRPFKYDINQIAYDYTVDMTNRFKGLDLVERVPEEPWMEFLNIVQEVVTKAIPKKKKHKKTKGCLMRSYKRSEKRREEKGKEDNERYITEWRVPENSKEK